MGLPSVKLQAAWGWNHSHVFMAIISAESKYHKRGRDVGGLFSAWKRDMDWRVLIWCTQLTSGFQSLTWRVVYHQAELAAGLTALRCCLLTTIYRAIWTHQRLVPEQCWVSEPDWFDCLIVLCGGGCSTAFFHQRKLEVLWGSLYPHILLGVTSAEWRSFNS